MVSVADKVKEMNLSDDSGIDSPNGDVNVEISKKVETDTLSNIIIDNEEASVRGFEEAAVDAKEAYKAAGKIQIMLVNLCIKTEKTLMFFSFSRFTGRFRSNIHGVRIPAWMNTLSFK